MSNLTKLDSSALAAAASFSDDFFEDKTGNASPSFTTFSADLGGFEDQDGKNVSEIVGYTVHTRSQVALWISKDAPQPALSSFDGVEWDKWDDDQLADLKDPEAYKVPVADSKYMQWGKDESTGTLYKGWHPEGVPFDRDLVKSAKETVIFYVLVEGQDIPVAVKVAAGSFKYVKAYKKELAKDKLTLPKVQTKFTVKKETGNGNKWATVQFEAVGVVGSKEEWDAITTSAKLTQETLASFVTPQAPVVAPEEGGEVPF